LVSVDAGGGSKTLLQTLLLSEFAHAKFIGCIWVATNNMSLVQAGTSCVEMPQDWSESMLAATHTNYTKTSSFGTFSRHVNLMHLGGNEKPVVGLIAWPC
jgi:hypothetical protein